MLLYVDNTLCIHHGGKKALEILDRYLHLKEGSIGEPDLYLGVKLHKVTLPNGVHTWSTSPSKYTQDAVRNVEEYLHKECGRIKLAKRSTTLFPRDYAPELDMSPVLISEIVN